MKKSLVVGALVLALGVGSLVAYADTAKTPSIISGSGNQNLNDEDREIWYKERTEFKKEQIKKALESGSITEKEAKAWEEHFTYMEEFHNENGFMPSGCGRFSIGQGMGMMRGNGSRRGMMRGNGWGI